ncbi:conserved protein, unknown function [Hepatocystis sp. ex Piliocolobus tephrosceles]|nr:conserved protein, unknown function [Hepatocystis sp. ex Piliocolobus tephrosceles]
MKCAYVFFFSLCIVFSVFVKNKNFIFIEGIVKKNNFLMENVYSDNLLITFVENDYHFFRLIFIKLLIQYKILSNQVTLSYVVDILDNIDLSVKQKADFVYLILYEEMKELSSTRYENIYQNKNIDTEINNEIEIDKLKEKEKKSLLDLITFNDEIIFYSEEYYKKMHLLFDICYISILRSYQSLGIKKEKVLLRLMYENVINQWMILNYTREIMQYDLQLNNDSILFYVALNKMKDGVNYIMSEENIKVIQSDLTQILDNFVNNLNSYKIGNGNSAFFISKHAQVKLPLIKVIGYMTLTENKLVDYKQYIKMDKQNSVGTNIAKVSNDSIPNNTSKNDMKKIDNDVIKKEINSFNEYLKRNENNNKIIVQVLLISTKDNIPKENDENYSVSFSIEHVYNILIDYFIYNEKSKALLYDGTFYIISEYIFGKGKEKELTEEEEKKYEDISVNIFLKIIGSVNYNLKQIQRFIKLYSKTIIAFYNLHVYGACLKTKGTNNLNFVAAFGQGVDSNLVNNVLKDIQSDEIIAHIKVYSKAINNKKHKLKSIAIKDIIEELDKSPHFSVIYFLEDSSKEIYEYNCVECRYYKYHFVTLFIAAFVPSFIIFFLFYMIFYGGLKKINNYKYRCNNKLYQAYPRIFFVRTLSNRYVRWNKKNGKKLIIKKKAYKKKIKEREEKIKEIKKMKHLKIKKRIMKNKKMLSEDIKSKYLSM